MNKVAKNIAKGLAITGLATGIVSGTLATGTGMLIGYYAQKDIDALATEYSQTQEFAELSNAEAERLEERFQFLEDAKQDYSEGALSSEQIAEFEDEYKTEVEYFQQDFIYDCLANTEDAYFQEKLEKCMKPKNVAKGFFYTGIAIYGLKFLIAGTNARISLYRKDDDPSCTTTYLRYAIKYVKEL